MYRLIRDGLVGVVFIFSIHILTTIIFNWLCFGKFSIWIKNGFNDDWFDDDGKLKSFKVIDTKSKQIFTGEYFYINKINKELNIYG